MMKPMTGLLERRAESERAAGPTMRRRGLLNAFLASVMINAALGVWALLSSDFGSTQGKILATSFCVSGAMLGILVNGTPLARRVYWPLPVIATAASVAAAVLLIVMIWAEVDAEWWWKSLVTLLMIAAAAILVGLLGLLALRPNHVLLRLAHALSSTLLVGTSTVALWAELDLDWLARLIGVESVVVAALTMVIPALARFQPPEEQEPDEPPETIVCPCCATRLDRWGNELPMDTTTPASTVEQGQRV